MSLNSYLEAYEKPISSMNEKVENPQVYDRSLVEVQHVKPKRQILGLVGGNEVYNIAGNRVDLESDLQGITRPNTWSTTRKHLPSANPDVIERKNPKNSIRVDGKPVARGEFQMWSYPAVYAPLSVERDTCMPKNKF